MVGRRAARAASAVAIAAVSLLALGTAVPEVSGAEGGPLP